MWVCESVGVWVSARTFIIPFQLSPVDTRNSVRKAIPKFSKVAWRLRPSQGLLSLHSDQHRKRNRNDCAVNIMVKEENKRDKSEREQSSCCHGARQKIVMPSSYESSEQKAHREMSCLGSCPGGHGRGEDSRQLFSWGQSRFNGEPTGAGLHYLSNPRSQQRERNQITLEYSMYYSAFRPVVHWWISGWVSTHCLFIPVTFKLDISTG